MPKSKLVDEYVEESGIFAKDQAIAQLTIANQQRSAYADAFESAITAFSDTLMQDEKARCDFYDMLDQAHIDGLVEMVKRHTHKMQYHIAEHAAEVAHDTDVTLTKIYAHKFPNETLRNNIMRYIAVAAGAWHDLVQSKGAPDNEIESAKEFTNYLRVKFSHFGKKHPACRNAIYELTKYLDFIANELIVYDTWLVFSLNKDRKIVAKTLRQHSRALDPDNMPHTPMLERLWLAADTISVSDTSRFALEHVRDEKILVHALTQLPTDARQAIEAFFQYANMTDTNIQEEFLGLMGQDIRMFAELNTTEISHISTSDYAFFIESLYILRLDNQKYKDIDFKKLLDLFMTTLMKKALQPNIQQEINFAKAIGTGIWTRHADDLVKFQSYCATLDDAEKNSLSKGLFMLATGLQPGNALLMNNDSFKQAILHTRCASTILTFFHLKNKQATANLELYQQMFNQPPSKNQPPH